MAEKFKVLVFDKDLNSLRSERFVQLTDKHIETKSNLYDLADTEKYYNESDGLVYYVCHADIKARQESENLKKLRRSVTLNNLFKYDVKKPFDVIGFMPWLIILALIIF